MKLIKEIEIEEKVINIIRNITKEYVNKEKIINSVGAGFHPCPNYKKTLQTLQNKITELQKVNLNLYKDKVKEVITEQQFLELLEETNKEKEK